MLSVLTLINSTYEPNMKINTLVFITLICFEVSDSEDSYCGPSIDPLTVQEIQSYGYPITEYKPNLNCKWNIEAQYGYYINIEIVEFNTISTDKLNVYDINKVRKRHGFSFEKRLIKSYSGKTYSTTLTTKSNLLIIEFKTDSSDQSKGFLLRIHRENKCHAINSRTVKTLFSPDYPSNYPKNIECSWIITADQNEFITLYFENLWLIPRSDESDYDGYPQNLLYVYNKININRLAPILELKGNIESYYFKTNSSSITVVFRAFSGYSDVGFQIHIFRNKKVLDIKSCGKRIISETTRIISPNYPGNYENNINCIWNINGINNSKIHLTFNDFSTQSMRDVLYVYDANTTNHTLIGEYSGFSLPENLTSTSNDMTLIFKSDESNVEKGFDITIKFEILLENAFYFISQTKSKSYIRHSDSSVHQVSNMVSNEIYAQDYYNYYKIIAFNVKKSFLIIFKDQSNEIEIHENYKKPAMNSNAIKVIKNVGKPNSIAIDWIHDLVYWIDSENNEIKAFEYLEPNNIYSIHKSNVSYYTNLIINVEKSFLLWISVEKRYEIIQSTQDGENQKTMFSHIRRIAHLVIDYHSKKYYFILGNSLVSLDFNAQNQNRISSYDINFDSVQDQDKVFTRGSHFDSIINLFILNKELFCVIRNELYKLIDNQLVKPFIKMREVDNYWSKGLDKQQIHYIIGFDNQSQPEFENKCLTSNCSYACVPTQSPDNYRCLCPINMERVNQTDCQTNSDFKI